MAYGRYDRDYSSHDQDDDRQGLTGRWIQDDETGHLRRRFDDERQSNDTYRGDRGMRDFDDRRNWGHSDGYYGEASRRSERSGGHAFDFARRDSGRSDLGDRSEDRPFEGPNRFADQSYGRRSGGYDDRARQELSSGSPREWPQRANSISRYVSAEGQSEGWRNVERTGSFRGKGPKGYVRSDERIREDVSDRLSDDDTLDASDITVEVAGGEVTLSGFVDSRQAKHTAEECAEQCVGVTHVQNNLRVRPNAGHDQSSAQTGTDQLRDKSKSTDL